MNIESYAGETKSLNKIVECQLTNNFKKGLGYKAVAPPHRGVFPPMSYEFKEHEIVSLGSTECKSDSEESLERLMNLLKPQWLRS